MIDFLLSVLRMSTPLIFAALGGLLSERSGVVNIALEGFMLVGALVGAIAALTFHDPWLAWIMAFIIGFLFSSIYAFFTIELKSDQIVTGTAINLLVIGTAPFVTKILYNSTGSTPALPLEERFTFEPMIMALFLVLIIGVWFYKTKSGLWLQFAGEHPEALATSGVSPKKVRWWAVMSSGGVAALGGASLSIFLASAYSPLMSGGRGFMALAALIFGKWKPFHTLAACLFFGLTEAIQIRLQGASEGLPIPVQFVQIIPYIITIIALAGFIGVSKPPKALGK